MTKRRGSNDLKPRVSDKKRRASNFERLKDLADVYDNYFGQDKRHSNFNKIKMNLNLYNGRVDTKFYSEATCFNVGNEKVKFESEAIIHNPIMSQVANSLFGQIYLRNFKPKAKHHGSGAVNMKKMKWNELVKRSHQELLINPLRERIYQQYIVDNNIQDIRSLTPEQLQQVNSDVEQRTNSKLPKDLLNFMFNEYETPTQQSAQRLLNYYVDKLGISNKYIDSFIWPITAGESIICIDDVHGKPTFDIWNPAFVSYGGGHSDETLIQKMDWVKYECWGSYQYITQKYAEHLKNKDYKILEDCLMPILGNSKVKVGEHDSMSREIIRIHNDGGWVADKEYQGFNDKTIAGQNKLKEIYSRVLSQYGDTSGNFSNYGIRECKFFFRDKRHLKRVTRNEGGKEVRYWMDEHYEPTHLDIEVVDLWVDEVQRVTKIGEGDDALYLKMGPVPGQYKSIHNPWDVELPVYGGKFNTHMNMVDNVAIMDLSKADQMQYDIIVHQMRRDMNSDLGTIFTFIQDYKPSSMSWQEWFSVIRTGKVAMLNPRKKGITGVDPQFLKKLDLSKVSDIAQKLQLLQHYRSNIITNMHTNAVSVQGASPYATNEGIQTARAAGTAQTENIFDLHTRTFEAALNGLMERVKYLYSTGELNVDELLNESGITDLQLSEGFSWDALKIAFKLSRQEEESLERMRSETLTLLQNANDPETVWDILRSQTTDEVNNVFRRNTKKLEEQQKQQQEMIAQQQQAEREFELRKIKIKLDAEKEIEQLKAQTSITRTQIDSTKFEKAADVDGNNVSDKLELEQLKLIQKDREHQDKMALERDKLKK